MACACDCNVALGFYKSFKTVGYRPTWLQTRAFRHVVGAFVARLHVSQATLIPTRRWNTKCKSAFGTLQVVQNSSREIMKLTPLDVPTSLLQQPQDGNSNSQSRINRQVL